MSLRVATLSMMALSIQAVNLGINNEYNQSSIARIMQMVANKAEVWKEENIRSVDLLTDASLIEHHRKYIDEKLESAERKRESRWIQFELVPAEEEVKLDENGFAVIDSNMEQIYGTNVRKVSLLVNLKTKGHPLSSPWRKLHTFSSFDTLLPFIVGWF